MPLDQEIGDPAAEAAKVGLKKIRQEQGYMPMSAHLGELRNRLMRSVIWIAVFATVAYFFYDYVWSFIMGPVADLIRKSRLPDMPSVKIMTTRLGDNFAIEFKILLLAGFILSFPFIIYEIWRFITPALSAGIRRWGSVILISSVSLFWCGVLFARLVSAFLSQKTQSGPWAVLGVLKLVGLFACVYILVTRGGVSAYGIALGFAALPIGITLGTLFRGKPSTKPAS